MQSMTGFGRGEAQSDTLEISVEVSSVNRKSLEVGISLPRDWQAMERDLSDQVRAKALRGKVSVHVNVSKVGTGAGLDWDDEKVVATVRRMEALARDNGFPFEPTGELFMRVINSLETGSDLPTAETGKPLVVQALSQALDGFCSMRSEEGAAMRKDLLGRLDFLGERVGQMREIAAETVPEYRALLMQRLQKAGLELDIEDDRVLKELALFADRSDITEELTRLDSHFEQFRATIDESGAIGRKMDFLCQEINREINTCGSKANHLALTRNVLDCKNELERIREQAQNVE